MTWGGVRTAVALLALCGWPALAWPQSAENVAIVVNDDSPDSVRIADHYIRRRGLPDDNVIHIKVPPQETIQFAAYTNLIEAPIRAAIGARGLHDRLLYLVLTKGIPLRIVDGSGATTASVDSQLTLLYRRLLGAQFRPGGRVPNPYFLGTSAVATAARFTHRVYDIYLVTRLDAFSVDDAMALIDRASAPIDEGWFVLDQRGSLAGSPAGDLWLAEASRRLAGLGMEPRVLLETTRAGARTKDRVLGYYSWASSDPQNRARRLDLSFAPGALAAAFSSGDARTFQEPPAEWTPTGNWQIRTSWFQGGPESLIGDLIREGVTGVAGSVADPFLQSAIRPEILFPAYASGFNLAEAFYLAMPHLSWQLVVIGDPLCAPFRGPVLTRAEIEEPESPDTGLPGLFSQRRLAALQAVQKDVPADALALVTLSESRIARRDFAGAESALEKAVASAPDLSSAHLQLAMLYELGSEPERAIAHYERVVAKEPKNVIALNNLAYALAVRRKAPNDARPFALKAMALSPRDPQVLDTVAWIEHLRGDHTAATTLIRRAARGAPDNADVRIHAAFIHAAVGAVDTAAAELDAALTLKPELVDRADVRALQQQLRKPSDSPLSRRN